MNGAIRIRVAGGKRAPGTPDRKPRLLSLLLLAFFTAAVAGPAAAYRFMPTGDSITEGVGSTSGLGFRHILYTSLNTIGSFDFVGPSGSEPDEGDFFSSARITDFRAGGTYDLGLTMAAYTPDLVAIHLGTNDILQVSGPYGPWSFDHKTPNPNVTGDLGALVSYALSAGAGRVVVSRIIPIEGRAGDMAEFNREVVRMVLDHRNGAVTGVPTPVHLADHYRRFINNPDAGGDWMFDPVHPNDAGYDQMENAYFEAVREALNDVTPPAAVSDLAIGTVNGSSVLLVWTNTGDDVMVGDPRYADCRVATTPIIAANFKTLAQGGDYAFVGRGGEVSGTRMEGLAPATAYYFALKLADDAMNLAAMSNTVVVATTGSNNVFEDSFTRAMATPGPDWRANDYTVNGSELVNTGPTFAAAIFTAVTSPARVELTWGAGADAPGINQAGIACRLEDRDPAIADGYIVYRNTAGNQNLILREVVDGVPGLVLDTALSLQPAPGAGDRFAVELSSDGDGHRFVVFVNGAFDGVLVDPIRRRGNGDYWCGVLGDGSFNNDVTHWRVDAVSTNLPPLAFALATPANGSVLENLNPAYSWQATGDPNGDLISYDLFISPDPDFPPAATIRVDNLAPASYATGVPLAANTTYHWRVRAQDPQGASTWTPTWSFTTRNLQQVGDDFERTELGPDWVADPGYGLVNGELAGSAPGFGELAVYVRVPSPVAVEWRWSETATSAGIGSAGCLLGLDGPSTAASGYFVFRNTSGAQRWSVWEVRNGELFGSLNIDVSGANPIPGPGDRVRVVFVRGASANVFECYINDRFDARLSDSQRRQGTGATTFAGLLLGNNTTNNVEEFMVMGEALNLPPAPFNLLQPSNQSIVYSLAPQLRWEAAFDPNPGDQVRYTVVYDTDPAFPNPESLPPTTATATIFRAPLAPSQAYHWRVRAVDASGGEALSRQTWTFVTAPVQVVIDDFNRAQIGPDWGGDAVMQIVGNELRNISGTTSFDQAVYAPLANPNAAGFRWSPSANRDGILRGGLALMMDSPTANASGYWLTIDPFTNRSKLEEIRSGGTGYPITNATGAAGIVPQAGSSWRVLLTSDADGHHFDVYVGDDFHSRLTDPLKRQGNLATLYAGVALRGQYANAVDDFTLKQSFGPAPSPFALRVPAHGDTGVAYRPPFAWRAAGATGVVYVVYVGTDSTFAAADSLVALTDTTLVWPTPLDHDRDYFWRVRATNGLSSALNTLGWHRFRTTSVSAVELAGFEARGDVGQIVLTWRTERESDHLGFHVWRALEAAGPYTRLTGPAPLAGRSPYAYADPVPPGTTCYYRLEAVSRRGDSQLFGPVSAAALALPRELALHPNSPNPFNPATALTFDLPAEAAVRLVVFDLAGRAVRELASGVYPSGRHVAIWDGRTAAGQVAGSGIYFARLSVGEWSATRKLILVK